MVSNKTIDSILTVGIAISSGLAAYFFDDWRGLLFLVVWFSINVLTIKIDDMRFRKKIKESEESEID